MTQRFANKRAVVTGASRGIGKAVAIQLARDGCEVAIVARSIEDNEKIAGSLNETADEIRAIGKRCLVIGADLTNADDRSRIIPQAINELGAVDILINNAAAAIYHNPENYSLKHRRLSMEVNYHAPADLMQAAIPHMMDRGQGWIVNLTSGAANFTQGPPFELRVEAGLYGATKAALNRLTNAMGASLHGTGIRVNAVAPRAAVLSEGADALVGNLLNPEQVEPMESMVAAVLLLCDCSAEMTAQVHVSLDLIREQAF